ncbi:serine/threonine protein kinase [Leptolyngbya sp. FACHB-671]|uniref:serine/threonine-protein kinase n=1 Tax=Leptolyngbya sp. FACHB-671 TaxID=2692812 RepID=UPI00168487D6|nr:serine/threonine-protein kinase [Leptolyngbya sp. FACHB-671]MBD2068156.1 serine/threonine protein kinase [Leptolyngbya sp. FACHB-671]
MSLCINPRCLQPDHPGNDGNQFCQSCGSDLILQGRYRVMRLLSDKSGFGKVYEAFERSTPKILKVLKESHSTNPKAVTLFQQEAVVLSQLQHPSIPQIEPDGYFQFFPRNAVEPLHCIIMEKIDGPNLTQWMRQQGNNPISEKQAVNWLQQIVGILHLVHSKNYFHRDIKPENIMLRSSGQLVLVDFGAAREMTYTYLAQLGGTSGVTRISSAGYTPPEQEQGQAVPQSDFYALGRTFIYLLTGKQPTDTGIYDSLQNEFHWRNHAPHISPQLAGLIDQLIAPRAADRPKDTQEILARLSQTSQEVAGGASHASYASMGGAALLPLSIPTVYQSPPKSRTWQWLSGGLLILLLGGGGYWLWQSRQSFPLIANSQRVENQAIAITRTFTGHSSFVNSLVLSSNGQTLISGSADKTIKIWNFNTSEEIRTLTGHFSFVNRLAVTPDGRLLVSTSADQMIKIWEIATGQELRTLAGHTSPIDALVITPDGHHLISGSVDQTIKIWEIATGQELRTLTGHASSINALVVTPDGQRLISGGADKLIKIWDINTGEEISTLTGHDSFINALAISPDGQLVASGSADKTIKIWNVETGEAVRTLIGHSGYVNSLAISPDGQTLASGSADQTIKLWDFNTGEEIRTLTGYGTHINYFVISPDWSEMASGSDRPVISVWRLPE